MRGSWVEDSIYFTENEGRVLSRVSAAGGQPKEVVRFLGKGLSLGVFTDVVPDGRAVLLNSSVESSGRDYNDLQAHVLDSGERKALIEHGYAGSALASGYLVFARGGSLMAARFDAKRLAVEGQPSAAVSDVSVESIFGVAHFAASPPTGAMSPCRWPT